MTDLPYHPIDCGFYDVLEALAVRRVPCTLTYRGADGAPEEAQGCIVDLFSRTGVEYLRLDTGFTLRLDHLVVVAGGGGCWRLPEAGAPDAGCAIPKR